MKKMMMGTAIALLASAGAVSAQEWSVDVKGVFVGGFGYVDVGDDADNIGLVRDPEVHVIGELVADNGLTFGIRTEIEAADASGTGSADIDENFGYVKGSFGEFQIGEADGAADRSKYAGDVGSPWSRSGDGVGMLFDGAYYGGDTNNLLDSFSLDTSDDLKISYFLPRFSGFTAGVSYTPSNNDNGRRSTRGENRDAWEVGADYSGEFGGVSLGAGVGYTYFNDNNRAAGGDSTYAVGGSVSAGYAGFKLGVAYGFTEDGTDGAALGGTQFEDNSTLQVGLSYATGPWTVGGDVAFHLDDVIVADNTAGNAVRGEQLGFGLGVAYSLAPGVSVGLGGEYIDNDTPGLDDGVAVGTWLGMRF
jgi:predicted porin